VLVLTVSAGDDDRDEDLHDGEPTVY